MEARKATQPPRSEARLFAPTDKSRRPPKNAHALFLFHRQRALLAHPCTRALLTSLPHSRCSGQTGADLASNVQVFSSFYLSGGASVVHKSVALLFKSLVGLVGRNPGS